MVDLRKRAHLEVVVWRVLERDTLNQQVVAILNAEHVRSEAVVGIRLCAGPPWLPLPIENTAAYNREVGELVWFPIVV